VNFGPVTAEITWLMSMVTGARIDQNTMYIIITVQEKTDRVLGRMFKDFVAFKMTYFGYI